MNRVLSDETEIALIKRDVSILLKEVGEVKAMLHDDYVKRDEFVLVRNIVFGTVGFILTAVLGWAGSVLAAAK